MTGDVQILGGWARTGASGARVEEPASAADAADLLREAGPRGAIARGLGRAYGDAAQNAGGAVIATRRLQRILELDVARGLARVEGGVSIGALNRAALAHGWLVAAVPGTAHVTVGGAIASDVHGKNHRRDGGFCAHVPAFELATAAGERREVDREVDAEVFAATAGGMGLTGIVTEATLQLQRVETAYLRLTTMPVAGIDAAVAGLDAITARHAIVWLDLTARDGGLGRGVLTVGDHAAPGELRPDQRRQPLRLLPVGRPVPAWAPGGLIRPATIRALNALRLATVRPSSRIVPLESFLHPLDRIPRWSRLFGPAGLVEHHLVVPDDAVDALLAVVATIARRRVPAALAALKRLGSGSGLLSFPLPGWSLAVDYPAAWPELGRLLDDLDEIVAAAGGRVYLAKDSRLRPDLVPAMYPALERWRQIQRRLDPRGQLHSDLDRRLGLTGR